MKREDRKDGVYRPDEVIQDGFDGVYAWGFPKFISGMRDVSRRYLFVLHQPPDPQSGMLYEATLRLQGFVDSATLTPLGNWRK